MTETGASFKLFACWQSTHSSRPVKPGHKATEATIMERPRATGLSHEGNPAASHPSSLSHGHHCQCVCPARFLGHSYLGPCWTSLMGDSPFFLPVGPTQKVLGLSHIVCMARCPSPTDFLSIRGQGDALAGAQYSSVPNLWEGIRGQRRDKPDHKTRPAQRATLTTGLGGSGPRRAPVH